jgi:hypothetical protein
MAFSMVELNSKIFTAEVAEERRGGAEELAFGNCVCMQATRATRRPAQTPFRNAAKKTKKNPIAHRWPCAEYRP